MSAPPFLTDEEIARITRPLKQGAARCRYFLRLGIKVDPRPDGQPLVGRAEFEAARMAKNRAGTATGPAPTEAPQPDWGALQRRRLRAVV